MPNDADQVRRILVIDDTQEIFHDFQLVLGKQDRSDQLDDLQAMIFDEPTAPTSSAASSTQYQLDYASQGQEGLQRVQTALDEGDPYRMAFVDMRMPPGWDGLETIERIWEIDEHIQVVICTAYSDHSYQDIHARLGDSDRLLILKKPFDHAEVAQLACALTHKWDLSRQASLKLEELQCMVQEQTGVIRQAQQTAERTDQAKSDFFRGMCERIRPNTETMLDLCDHIAEEPLSKTQSQCLERVTSTGKNLLSVIEDLLAVSSMEAPS